jgi:hypothetical protein
MRCQVPPNKHGGSCFYFGINPPVVHRVGTVIDASGVGSEVWQGQLPLVLEHVILPPTMALPMSTVKSPVAVAHLSCPLVPLVYSRAGDWCAPVPYEIYVVAAVDVAMTICMYVGKMGDHIL